MTLQAKDRSRIFIPIAAFLASIAAAGAMIYLSGNFQQKMSNLQQAASRKFSAATYQLSHARQEKQDLDIYDAPYRTLVKRQIVGDLHRLDLVEEIMKTQAGKSLFEMNYAIAPESKVAVAPLDLILNRVTFELQALHEEQVTNFLESLQQAGKGLPFIENCAIDRINPDQDISYRPQLKVKCTLAWVGLIDKGEQR